LTEYVGIQEVNTFRGICCCAGVPGITNVERYGRNVLGNPSNVSPAIRIGRQETLTIPNKVEGGGDNVRTEEVYLPFHYGYQTKVPSSNNLIWNRR
jgi:hypothetical protein